uniref:Uncharacterized protein n=1 Tax=Arundo donax TaxID=35708 RepID=A0A0A9A8E8_ARUDO
MKKAHQQHQQWKNQACQELE